MKVRGRLQKTGIWSRESGVNYTLTATEVGHDGNSNNHFDNCLDNLFESKVPVLKKCFFWHFF